MARKRQPRNVKPWDRVHDHLAGIFQLVKYYKTNRSQIKAVYFGTSEELRKSCIRILNAIDAMKKENEDGLPPENRWT